MEHISELNAFFDTENDEYSEEEYDALYLYDNSEDPYIDNEYIYIDNDDYIDFLDYYIEYLPDYYINIDYSV